MDARRLSREIITIALVWGVARMTIVKVAGMPLSPHRHSGECRNLGGVAGVLGLVPTLRVARAV